jgi:hypothetical protein
MDRENFDKRFIEVFDSLAQDYILTNMGNPQYKNIFDAIFPRDTYSDGYESDREWEEAPMASIQPEERPLRPRQPQQSQQQQMQQPQQRPLRPQPMPQPPRQQLPLFPRRPQSTRAARLAGDIYRQIRSLETMYEQLARIAPRGQVEQLLRMQREMRLLAIPALNIYIALSGNFTPIISRGAPESFPNNYCAALRVTFNRANDLYDDVLALQRLVNIASIDRQLIIIASVVQRQLTTMNRMLIDCYTR